MTRLVMRSLGDPLGIGDEVTGGSPRYSFFFGVRSVFTRMLQTHAGLSAVPDQWIPDYWNFIVLYCTMFG
jgi:hypothetical protein